MVSYIEFLADYPAIDDPAFQQQLFNKEEFYDKKLQKDLEPPSGGLLNHQAIISRFVSPHTMYDELLVYHEMGTGKTLVAFASAEKLRHRYRRAYVLSRGPDLLISLMKNLITYSNNYAQPRKEFSRAEMAKITADFYEFKTFDAFAKDAKLRSDESILKLYSNCVFILDEIHNIKTDESAMIYSQMKRVLHLVNNRKILALSGTPMTDDVTELPYIMNLLLPSDEEMPTGRDFSDRFINKKTGGLRNTVALKKYLRGRVSFLRAAEGVPVIFETNPILPRSAGNIPQFNLFATEMSEVQSGVYSAAFRLDTQSEKRGIYNNARQANLCVMPNGTFGSQAEQYYNNGLSKEVKTVFRNIRGLREYSCKYASVIQNILDNPDKNIYIYCNIINGSGANLFARILELYGYQRYKRGAIDNAFPARRYILLTSETSNINNLLEYFNHPRNATGQYCNIVIGSKKISEGFNFRNVQIIHLLTLFWNNTETSQAIFRARRYAGHNDLIALGITPVIQIYKHDAVVGLTLDDLAAELERELEMDLDFDEKLEQIKKVSVDAPVKSIDEMMNTYSRLKDFSIKQMDRVIKEVSFDCPLTWERNAAPTGAITGSADCDYQECEYACDSSTLARTEDDYSTFNLYYANEGNYLDKVKQWFFNNTEATYNQLIEYVQPPREFTLLQILDFLITEPMFIEHKNGHVYFLKEYKDRYFLIEEVMAQGFEAVLLYQNTLKPLYVEKVPFAAVVMNLRYNILVSAAQLIKNVRALEELRRIMATFSVEIQRYILETALKLKAGGARSPRIEWLISIYNNFFIEQEEYPYVISMGGKTRCLRGNAFVDCAVTRSELNQQNEYGHLGLVSEDGTQFCIKRLVNLEHSDRRLRPRGTNCMHNGWFKKDLIQLILKLGIQPPSNDWKNYNPKPIAGIQLEGDELKKYLYWSGNATKDIMCGMLKEWFREHNLLFTADCGGKGAPAPLRPPGVMAS